MLRNLYLLIVDDTHHKGNDRLRFDGPRCAKSLTETLLKEMEN